MKSRYFLLWVGLLLLCTECMAQGVYCPQNARFISVGMTQEEVIAACGQPLSKIESNMPATQKIPVQELIYTALNTGSVYPGLNAAYYTQWSLPSGSSGINLKIDIINDKVTGVTVNGTSTNSMSMCGGSGIQSGDSVTKVYNACGTPTIINQSYINQVIPSKGKPVLWVYQLNQYQSPISLTFIDGKLQSIN